MNTHSYSSSCQLNRIKQDFIELLLRNKALKFGNFTLKSGRQSPYFFNLGSFHTGASLAALGYFYAELINRLNLNFDVLFGPAYKGIPLVSATSIILAKDFNQDCPYCFNRKLKKTYGDGGDLVGAPLQGQVIMVDDVITAGTTVRETLTMMQNYDAKLAGIVIAFDRQEKNQSEQSAVAEIIETYKIPIYSIATLEDVLSYLQSSEEYQCYLPSLLNYRAQYGA